MNMRNTLLMLAICLVSGPVISAPPALHSPRPGVLCDSYICADGQGISRRLTSQYLGQVRGDKLRAMGAFDTQAFTFEGGVFCDVRARLCRDDRYFGPDGKRSGAINKHYTQLLFGGHP